MDVQLESFGFFDINVIVESTIYPVHRIILHRFPFFQPLIDGNFKSSSIELDFMKEDWEYILSMVYSALYPEIFIIPKVSQERLVSICLLADYLGDRGIFQRVFSLINLSSLDIEGLRQLTNIQGDIKDIIIERVISKYHINIQEYPELFEDLLPFTFKRAMNVLLPDKPSPEAELLNACSKYYHGLRKNLDNLWHKVPDNLRLIIATSYIGGENSIPIQWLIENSPELVKPWQLTKGKYFDLSIKTLNRATDKDKFIIEVCKHTLKPKIWEEWMDYGGITACRAFYIFYIMKHASNSRKIQDYIKKNVQSLPKKKFRGVGMRCMDKFWSRYRWYLS